MSCPNCGYCDKCGRSNPPQVFPTQPLTTPWNWCSRCGRTHGMFEVCPMPWITYTTTTSPNISLV